jgi:rhodanese-related sulfurtransferase/DNA-binding transcriptional ArsR family regulator
LNNRALKRDLFDQFARVGKALASAERLALLDVLAQAPRTVDALAKETGATVANASQHLQVLRAAGLVESDKEGLFVRYRLAGPRVATLVGSLRELAADRLADVERARRAYFGGDEPVVAMSRRELLRGVKRGEVVLLDVRPAEEYAAGHLPGAVSVPIEEIDRRLADLPRDVEIVAYCRGPYCAYASEAVRRLRKRRFKASRLEDGVHEWRAHGLPIDQGRAERTP